MHNLQRNVQKLTPFQTHKKSVLVRGKKALVLNFNAGKQQKIVKNNLSARIHPWWNTQNLGPNLNFVSSASFFICLRPPMYVLCIMQMIESDHGCDGVKAFCSFSLCTRGMVTLICLELPLIWMHGVDKNVHMCVLRLLQDNMRNLHVC